VRRHAWEAHGISFSTEDALAVLLRMELELEEGVPADLAVVEDTTHRKEREMKVLTTLVGRRQWRLFDRALTAAARKLETN
jgi:hypothetical protein